MVYSQLTLAQLSAQLGVLLDDQNSLYWTDGYGSSAGDKQYAIWDALRVWGAYTNYWRQRGTFNLTVNQSFYDLSVELPALRTRTWTLDALTKEIQYMCLEAANGISGAGMSAQISVSSILQAIQRARNQFVIDARFPYTYHSTLASVAVDGSVAFPQASVYVHRASWQDAISGAWTNLWREDAWAIDHADPSWITTPGSPVVYSESEFSPLSLQLSPAPAGSGILDAITVDSLQIDITDPTATFDIPDEWIHAVKFAALQDIFSAESQNKDALRAQYCQMRYDQAMDLARMGRSIMRLLYNSAPLPIDSLQAIDAGQYAWRNQPGPPQMAGVLYDFCAFNPGAPDQAYGIAADVVQSAPLPTAPGDFIPVGYEDIPHLLDYITHALTFKCGGKEFTDTFPQYDSFMAAAQARGRINAAKIRYLTPLFGQPQKEQAVRPDRLEKKQSAAP